MTTKTSLRAPSKKKPTACLPWTRERCRYRNRRASEGGLSVGTTSLVSEVLLVDMLSFCLVRSFYQLVVFDLGAPATHLPSPCFIRGVSEPGSVVGTEPGFVFGAHVF